MRWLSSDGVRLPEGGCGRGFTAAAGIDARAAAARFSLPDLEELGRRHAHDPFDLPTLQSRLTGTDFYSDADFTRYGLDDAAVTALRAWAQHWSDDIAERLMEEGESPDEESPE